jgi:hypothetical protein
MKNAIIDKQHHKQSFFKLIFLGILFVLATTFTSFGQTKSEKIDRLMARFWLPKTAQLRLVKVLDWQIWNGIFQTSRTRSID